MLSQLLAREKPKARLSEADSVETDSWPRSIKSPRKSISFEDESSDPGLAILRDTRVLQQKKARSALSAFTATHAQISSLDDSNPNKTIFTLLKYIKENLDNSNEEQVQRFIAHEITRNLRIIMGLLNSANDTSKLHNKYLDRDETFEEYFQKVTEIVDLLNATVLPLPLIFRRPTITFGTTQATNALSADYFSLDDDEVDEHRELSIISLPTATTSLTVAKKKPRSPEDSCFERIRMLFSG